MELDDLKKSWQVEDRALDSNLRWRPLGRYAATLRRSDSTARRLLRGLAIEVVVSAVATVLLGSFLASHVGEPRFFLPALLLDLAAIFQLAIGVRHLVAARRRDDAEPVVAAQKRLEALRVERLRATKWTLILAPLLWTPLLIVGLEGLWGVDAWAVFPPLYLAANALFGLAAIPAGLYLARRLESRLDRSPFLRSLARDLAGRNLAAAIESLAALTEFERDAAVAG